MCSDINSETVHQRHDTSYRFLLSSKKLFVELLRSFVNKGWVQAVNEEGGDSDTIGAIAGGLAGIYYGYEGIPARYAEAILIKERLDRIISQLYAVRIAV
jgi:ADP-ribosylglycohydrolase